MAAPRDRRRAALAVLLIVSACGLGSDAGPKVGGLVPVPTRPGAPLGPPTSATISGEGGTLSSPDGALSIYVPPGAVTSPTEFTITPIAATARGAVAGAFRLGPEGATFAVPVTLTFRGPEQYPQGGSIEDVGVFHQNRDGYWHRVEPAARDGRANTISVAAEHFSDWALAWTSGEPVAEGPIQLFQTLDIPFSAQGRAAVFLKDDSAAFTTYVLSGTLTVPATILVGNDVCVPDQITKSWVNIAEIDKARGVFRWGTGVHWTLTCTSPGGGVTTRTMPASFDTMGINFQCPGSYDPGQYAELDFLKGAYTANCGAEGQVRATWDLRGYQILVNPTSGLVTTEAGGTATFQISLNKPPIADVTVPLSSSDSTEGTVPPSVTFSPSNWSTPQTVTVTGVNDWVDDDDVAYAILVRPATTADRHYQGIDGDDVTALNLDDDTAGLTLNPTSGLVTTEAGGAATFQLTLNSEPVQDVVVSFTSSNPAEGAVSPESVTITPPTWNVPRTVTLTGVNDFYDDGDKPYTVQVSAASTDPKYQGLGGTVSATNIDDDTAGFTMAPATGLVTTEAGGTATFQLSLMSQPFADVTVALTSSDLTEGTVSPASVTFTGANWNVPQAVTVTGVNDFVDDGDIAYTVQLVGTSTDAGYGGRTGSVSVTNRNDDFVGFSATPSAGLVTTEAGGTATFQLALTSQPLADVVVALASSDITEGTVSPASVTFTAATWNLPQTITVTGVDDYVADGTIAYLVQLQGASTDPGYNGRSGTVSVTNLDNDFAGITVGTPSGTTTTEAGGSVTFTVALTSQPLADVTIPLSSSRPTEGRVSPASLTFTAANWNVLQTVTVTGVDDFVADGPQTYLIAIGPSASADPGYQGMDPADLTFTNLDNDFAGIIVGTPSGTATTEAGGSVTFTVVLTSQPTADVTIPLSSSRPTEGTVSPASLTFTAANWNAPQTVTVTGVDDFVADGPQTYLIAIGPAASADANYQGRDPADLTFTNADNDFAGITVGVPSGTSTSETGTSVTFTVVLTSQPTANVTIPLSSSRPTEGTVSPASLTFTAANWNALQTVTVTGVDDLVADGTQAYTIVIGPAVSADLNYNGRDPADLTFTNTDNDSAGITVGAPSGTSTSETGTSVTFTLVLTSQPTADVIIPLSSSRPTEGTVSPASATFTAANWNVPQTITVTGVDDFVADGPQTYVIAIGPAVSADPGYQGRDPADLTLTNLDNDVAGITVGTPSGTTTTEAGGSVTFTLVLGSQPTADVTIPLSSSRPTEGTVSPASVTFTALDWSTPRTVTVTGVDDAVADGPQTYVIAIGPATSADPSYNGRDPADLTLTNLDNDAAGITVGTPSGTTTTEAGGSVTFTLVLGSQPTADVTIPLSSSRPTEGTVSPASVVFTSANWNLPQTVTVTGVDDLVVDGPQTYVIAIGPATSADANYQGRDPADLTFTNLDNDAAGITVGTPSGTTTTEAGGSVTFTLVLTSQPTADVTIPLSSSRPTEGTVSSASVTFTALNWSTPRTITVTGVDDAVADGPQTYVIAIGPATSTDPNYSGRDPTDLTFTNTDNDTAGITVGTPSGVSTSETGTTVTFTLVLASQPTADVHIPLSSTVPTEGTVAPTTVTFTSANWSTPQTLTVVGVDDFVADGTQPYTITIGPATSTDLAYNGMNPADLTFTNTDNDTAGLVATPSTGLVTTKAGGTTTFQLTLSSQPLADVVVTIGSDPEGTASPGSATFTTATWNSGQTVTVTGLNGPGTPPVPYTITLSAASTDAAYQGRTGSVSVTNNP
ncbi:MAG TPA: Calx-beta domain-containing protein [Anaeromyxobacteraceae bacterium]|nr:Calx-beta domain-containing protein [Anaeromyxobacteraceae bacterium]